MTTKKRYGPKQFKSALKLPGGTETDLCFYPWKLDTYGCGCTNNCLYCYARSVLAFRGLWDGEKPAVANMDTVRKQLVRAFRGRGDPTVRKFVENRLPIRLGGMTDCFNSTEKQYGATLRLLRLLQQHEYPTLILTKNTLLATEEYMDAIGPTHTYPQYTITTPFDDVSKVFEPGAEPTSERLQAVETLADNGFKVAVRVNPLFPKYPDGHYAKGYKTPKPLRYFDWQLIDMIAEHKADTLIAGFLRLSTFNIRWIKEQTGQDLTYLFNPKRKMADQARHYSIAEKKYYYEKIWNMCKKHGVKFTICFDDDEAYETFRYMWHNPQDCCNGLDNIPEFKTTYQNIHGGTR